MQPEHVWVRSRVGITVGEGERPLSRPNWTKPSEVRGKGKLGGVAGETKFLVEKEGRILHLASRVGTTVRNGTV